MTEKLFIGFIDIGILRMHILYFSLELKWGATKCPMVCKVGEKCLSQWANGHNNFYFLLFYSTNHPKSPVTFNLITLSFLTTCKKSKSCNLWEGCCGNPVFPLSTLCEGIMTADTRTRAGELELRAQAAKTWDTRKKVGGTKSIKTDHYLCFLFNNPIQSKTVKYCGVSLQKHKNDNI